VKASEPLETALAAGMFAGLRAAGWRRSLAIGGAIGALAHRLGLRRRVAEANLAAAFPERSAAECDALLIEHYRELGRVGAEYARLAELARAPEGAVVAEARGLEHLERARRRGRGAILLSGHYGNFELLGAWLGRFNPVDFVVQTIRNRQVEAMISRQRTAAGVGELSAATGLRRVYEGLKTNRWVAMLGDQDAGRHGCFVPFLGRPASTAIGPARLALATGAALIPGFVTRRDDGRLVLEVEPALELDDPRRDDAVERLTALHVARLERHVRAAPRYWFWLHRRWKTAPPAAPAMR